MLQTIAVRFFKERFFDQAAQTAYYLLLSIFPFLLFLFSLVSYLPVNEEMLLSFIRTFAPEQAYEIIEQNVRSIMYKVQGKVLYLSLFVAFYLSSVAVQSLARSLDLANGYIRRTPFWRSLIRDLGMTLLFMLIISLSLMLPVAERALHEAVAHYEALDDWRGWLYVWPAVKWGIGTLSLFVFFLLFYKLVPTGRIRVKDVLPGALFTAIGWQLFSLGFGNYVARVDYTKFYGQLSGIILLVLWFYMSAVILMISGLLNAEWRKHLRRKGREG